MLSRNARRGQTIPIWAFGTLTVLALLAFTVNYGNSLYWQLRAQNAADAAAQGALSIQATRWNAMISDIHAAAVEEYRLRYIARDLAEMTPTGGQAYQSNGSCNSVAACAPLYTSLVQEYIQAANRYTQDVSVMQTLSFPTLTNTQHDITAAIANFQKNCATVQGGDCAFTYTLVNAKSRQSALRDVISDCCANTVGGGLTAPAGLNPSLYPLQIEVVACANVKPLFPSALSWVTAPAFTAIGRAAATTIMATQEFMELGAMVNPASGQVFQPPEFPENLNKGPNNPATNDQFLRIDYGGNQSCKYGNCGDPQTVTDPIGGTYRGTYSRQAIDVFTGWWTAVAVPPYSGALQIPSSQYPCSN